MSAAEARSRERVCTTASLTECNPCIFGLFILTNWILLVLYGVLFEAILGRIEMKVE